MTWCECPNEECSSRAWIDLGGWDVDFENDQFKCGTCQKILEKPLFVNEIPTADSYNREFLMLFVKHLNLFLHGLRESLQRLKRNV